MKKQQRKNDGRVGFLDISDSQAVLNSSGDLMKIRIFITVCFSNFKNGRIVNVVISYRSFKVCKYCVD